MIRLSVLSPTSRQEVTASSLIDEQLELIREDGLEGILEAKLARKLERSRETAHTPGRQEGFDPTRSVFSIML